MEIRSVTYTAYPHPTQQVNQSQNLLFFDKILYPNDLGALFNMWTGLSELMFLY